MIQVVSLSERRYLSIPIAGEQRVGNRDNIKPCIVKVYLVT